MALQHRRPDSYLFIEANIQLRRVSCILRHSASWRYIMYTHPSKCPSHCMQIPGRFHHACFEIPTEAHISQLTPPRPTGCANKLKISTNGTKPTSLLAPLQSLLYYSSTQRCVLMAICWSTWMTQSTDGKSSPLAAMSVASKTAAGLRKKSM